MGTFPQTDCTHSIHFNCYLHQSKWPKWPFKLFHASKSSPSFTSQKLSSTNSYITSSSTQFLLNCNLINNVLPSSSSPQEIWISNLSWKFKSLECFIEADLANCLATKDGFSNIVDRLPLTAPVALQDLEDDEENLYTTFFNDHTEGVVWWWLPTPF